MAMTVLPEVDLPSDPRATAMPSNLVTNLCSSALEQWTMTIWSMKLA